MSLVFTHTFQDSSGKYKQNLYKKFYSALSCQVFIESFMALALLLSGVMRDTNSELQIKNTRSNLFAPPPPSTKMDEAAQKEELNPTYFYLSSFVDQCPRTVSAG